MLIYRVSDCFVNEEMLRRRLQIQSKIPKSEHKKSRGNHHTNSGRGLEMNHLTELEKIAQNYAVNLKNLIDQALFFQNFKRELRIEGSTTNQDQKRAWHAVSVNYEIESIPKFNFNTDFGLREICSIRDAYEKSYSWKMSKPVRILGNFLRRCISFLLFKKSN